MVGGRVSSKVGSVLIIHRIKTKIFFLFYGEGVSERVKRMLPINREYKVYLCIIVIVVVGGVKM